MSSKKPSRIQVRNGRKILEAGEKVFSKYGYYGATLDRVAEIADMSQPNLHNYFKTKSDLYQAVLEEILRVWLLPLGHLNAEGDPSKELRAYIVKKMQLTRKYPGASRVFAHEMLMGAPMLHPRLATQAKAAVQDSAKVISIWIETGRLRPIDPTHLIFMIWASTQHYADFMPQVQAVTGRRLSKADYDAACDTICTVVLHGVIPPSQEV